MMARRLSILAICFMVCSLAAFGQSGLTILSPVHDFGSIPEEGGVVTHRFEGVNTSEDAQLILNVSTTCGCTTPHYSRKPIKAGEPFSIDVAFDPQGRPGPFEKVLVVYNSERRAAAELRIRGVVTPRERTIEESYPIAVAQGVRLTNNFLMMGNRPRGERHRIVIGVANTAQAPHHVAFINKVASGHLTIEGLPCLVQAGEQGELELTLEVPTSSSTYGTIRDQFEVVIDGKPTGIPFTVEALVVDSPDEAIGERGSARAATDTQTVRIGECRIDSGVHSGEFELLNRGEEELVVRAVECTAGIGCSLKAGTRIAAGKGVRVKALFDTGAFDYGASVGRITMVVNDPEHPVRRVRVSAILVE